MPFPHEKHPDELKIAVGLAIMAGQSAPQVCKALERGTFGDFGPYTLPVPTARYYAQQARKREAASGLTARAKGDLDQAITDMAREILSELDHELKAARLAKRRDLEKLGTITKGLKDLRGLIVPGKTTPAPSKQTTKPVDPFLATIAKPQTIRATSPQKTEKAETSRPGTTTQRESDDTPNATQTQKEVPSRPLDDAVYSWGTRPQGVDAA